MTTQFFEAVQLGRMKKLKLYLRAGMKFTMRDRTGRSALYYALHVDDDAKRRAVFDYILRQGVSPAWQDSEGKNALQWAVELQRSDQVDVILNDCAGNLNLSSQDTHGRCCLHHAVLADSPLILRLLLASFAKYRLSVDIPDADGLTPFLLARKLARDPLSSLLVSDGRASTQQFDSHRYRDSLEWREFAQARAEQALFTKKLDELNRLKVRGRLPVANALSRRLASLELEKVQQCADVALRFDRQAKASERGDRSEPHSLTASTLSLSQQETIHAAFDILGLQRGGEPVTTFVGSTSQPGRSATHTGVLPPISSTTTTTTTTTTLERPVRPRKSVWNLNDIMVVYTDQHTVSFRQPARSRLSLKGAVGADKKKISTLAILFGRELAAHARASRQSSRSSNSLKVPGTPSNQDPLPPISESPDRSARRLRAGERKGVGDDKKPHDVHVPSIQVDTT